MNLDPEAIGLKVGIELHRQLNTKSKLFCACPTVKPGEEPESRFYRMLRVTESELGEIDPAALFEAEKGINIEYIAGDRSSCLVEADEEPPHDLNEEALDSALIISLALHSDIVDEVHVMRKIVIDGSNTTGFQRTMVIGMNGYIEVAGKKVGVQTICLEEDAARLIERKDGKRIYHLDRLGIPLIEVSLEPVTGPPEEIEEIALSLGRLLKASKRVARGLGTVRQDVNISIKGGGIVEVKGVQKPELVRKVIYFEARRQLWLLELAKILKERGVTEADLDVKPMDVTDVFSDTESSIIKKAVKKGGKVLALKARGFSGLLKEEPIEGARLGRDLADLARLYGFAGIFHSDELPAYGISYGEVQKVKELLGMGKDDAFILLVGERVRAETCMNAIKDRLKASLSGPPPETRASTPEGKTRYLRPRPGSARMYPETDIPPIPIRPERLQKLKPLVPEPWEKTVEAYSKKFGIGYRLAENLLDQERNQLFERIIKEVALAPTFLAATLTETLTMLEREGVDVSSLKEEELMEVFRLVDRGKAAKEAIPDILRALASGKAKTAKEALEKLGLRGIGEEELDRIVDEVIAQNLNVIKEKGAHAFGLIMGRVMAKVRGKIDGAKVSEAVKRKLERLENTRANA
jgi:glutamyl-tRNA(Gln) amidotransferase subunit E